MPTFTIPAGTPTGPQTVDVCEATTPNNGNDWEFGVQWMSPTGSLQYVSGNSGPTEICATSTIDVVAGFIFDGHDAYQLEHRVGRQQHRRATVTGSVGGVDPTGSVAFYECGPTASPTLLACAATWTPFDNESLEREPPTLTPSPRQSFTPTSTGYWCFAAVATPGTPTTRGARTDTTDECFDVTPAGSSTVTAPTNSSIALGDSNTDGATVTGSVSGVDPTGTVAFYECGATVDPCVASGCTVRYGDVERDFQPGHCHLGILHPDLHRHLVLRGRLLRRLQLHRELGSECRRVLRRRRVQHSTVTAPENSSIVLGDSNTDAATVTGSVSGVDPTGTVAFYECGETVDPCVASGTPFDTETLSGTSNPGTVTSASFTPTSTGNWCFAAVYSGDSNYTGSSDQTDECFDVTPARNIHRFDADQLDRGARWSQHRRCGRDRQCRRWKPDRHRQLLRVRADGYADALHLAGEPGRRRGRLDRGGRRHVECHLGELHRHLHRLVVLRCVLLG